MPKYAITFNAQTTATSLKSILGAYMVTSVAAQAEIVECIWTGGGDAAAADIQHRGSLNSFTFGATGASTSIVPIPFSNSAAAASGNYGTNYTIEPTTINAVYALVVGFNQRGGMRWAVPQGEGFKISNPLTEKGATMGTKSSAAGTVDATLHFWQGN